MPVIQVTMLEGRTSEQKREFMARLTSAATEALGSNPESVRVILTEVTADHFAVAGVPISERASKS